MVPVQLYDDGLDGTKYPKTHADDASGSCFRGPVQLEIARRVLAFSEIQGHVSCRATSKSDDGDVFTCSVHVSTANLGPSLGFPAQRPDTRKQERVLREVRQPWSASKHRVSKDGYGGNGKGGYQATGTAVPRKRLSWSLRRSTY